MLLGEELCTPLGVQYFWTKSYEFFQGFNTFHGKAVNSLRRSLLFGQKNMNSFKEFITVGQKAMNPLRNSLLLYRTMNSFRNSILFDGKQ